MLHQPRRLSAARLIPGLLSVLLIGTAVGPLRADDEKEAETPAPVLYEEALGRLDEGELNSAGELLQRLINQHPEHVFAKQAYEMLARVCYQLDRPDDALRVLRAGLKSRHLNDKQKARLTRLADMVQDSGGRKPVAREEEAKRLDARIDELAVQVGKLIKAGLHEEAQQLNRELEELQQHRRELRSRGASSRDAEELERVLGLQREQRKALLEAGKKDQAALAERAIAVLERALVKAREAHEREAGDKRPADHHRRYLEEALRRSRAETSELRARGLHAEADRLAEVSELLAGRLRGERPRRRRIIREREEREERERHERHGRPVDDGMQDRLHRLEQQMREVREVLIELLEQRSARHLDEAREAAERAQAARERAREAEHRAREEAERKAREARQSEREAAMDEELRRARESGKRKTRKSRKR